jgi:hypothetical protein
VQLPTFFRKFGETEDPMFQDIPAVIPVLPDQGDVGSEGGNNPDSSLRKLNLEEDNPNV